METPFVFGKIATGKFFTKRNSEKEKLISNFKNHINTILISPRRWGKSSLMLEIARQYQRDKNLKFCFIDLFKTRTEEEFYALFTKNIVKATSNKTDEWFKNIKELLKK